VFLPSRWFPLTAPRVNFINHRKIAIIDSAIAFTGGMNIADEYYRPWRDLMVRIEGYGALALEHVFLEDWYFATGIAVPDPSPSPRCDALGADLAIVASGPDSEPWILDAYFMAVTQAKERVWIATPYFIPNQAMMEAFRTAAGRGVDVRIIVPRSSDVAIVEWASRSYYKDLLEAKVRILEYQGPMLHAKALLCDESLISVGSANMDSRSLKLSFEVACFASDERASRLLHAWLSDLQKGAEEVTVEAMARKTTLQKLAESVAHLLSPVL
jgi:cardiolipin synthase A/B